MSLTPALKSWRKLQRDALLAQRMAVGRGQHALWNAQITSRLLAALEPTRDTIIAGYWPFRGEFDPRHAMRAWRQQGARTALPVVVGKDAPLQFRDWWPGLPTRRGVYDLPVPEGSAVLIPQVMLIPPIGFDSSGFRLGYGGGYYDRTLAALSPQPLKIGVGFALSRIDTIQPQPHDIAMDFIVTQDALYQPSGGELVAVEPAIIRGIWARRMAQQRGD